MHFCGTSKYDTADRLSPSIPIRANNLHISIISINIKIDGHGGTAAIVLHTSSIVSHSPLNKNNQCCSILHPRSTWLYFAHQRCNLQNLVIYPKNYPLSVHLSQPSPCTLRLILGQEYSTCMIIQVGLTLVCSLPPVKLYKICIQSRI